MVGPSGHCSFRSRFVIQAQAEDGRTCLFTSQYSTLYDFKQGGYATCQEASWLAIEMQYTTRYLSLRLARSFQLCEEQSDKLCLQEYA